MNVERGMEIMRNYMEEEDNKTMMDAFCGELTLEDKTEFLHVVEKMLFFGPSNSMKNFVRVVLDGTPDLPTNLRCRMLEYVYEANEEGYIERLREWVGNEDMEVACRVYWLRQLSYYPLYKDDDHVTDWIGNVFVRVPEPFHRNRVIMDMFHTYEENERFPTFIRVMREYKKIFEDPVMYRVVFAQNIIRKDDLEDNSFIVECLEELLCIMLDDHTSFEAQADICDFFLNTENKHITATYHSHAETKMRELFRENMVSELSFYANRQNVHSESIETSSQEILEKLHEKYGLRPTTLEKLQQWRIEMEQWDAYKSSPKQEKISLCMNRIFFDKRLYGSTKDTLATIFGLVWRHIHHSTHEHELKVRLLQEMTDASGQCSTGIAVRLVNTLSGYDDFMLKISPREAILTRVMHHMNNKIMEVEDPQLQESLLHEMTMPSSDYSRRQNFLEFFKKEIASIKEILFQEYCGVVTDTDFDLYLRQAILTYEGEM